MATGQNLRETALILLRGLLALFDLKEEGNDYDIDIGEEDGVLSLNVDPADSEPAAVLIGKEGVMLAALQRVFFGALAFRMQEEIKQPIFISVNGRRPVLSPKTPAPTTNGHPVVAPSPKAQPERPTVVTVIVPAGVEVRTRTE